MKQPSQKNLPFGINQRLDLLYASLLYLILILGITYPAIEHWGTQMIGGAWDSGQNIWNFWWIDKAIQQGNYLPYYTDMLYHPTGVSLALHPLALFNGYQAVLFHNALGMTFPAAYNTIAVIAFIISAVTSYWLVKQLTHNTVSAFIAGLIFAFSPVHLSRLHFGNLELFTSVQFVPLVAICVIKGEQARQWRYWIMGGVLIAAIGWQNLQMALGTCLFASMALLVFGNLKRDVRELLIQCLGMFLVSGVLLLPVAYPILRDLVDFPDQRNQTLASLSNSPDLLFYFLPDRSISTFWRVILGNITQQPLTDFFQIHGQRTVFLGWSVIILAIYSIRTVSISITWRWWIIAVFFFILSLGPALQINDKVIFAPMPYDILTKLPVIGLGREPARFVVFMMLPLAVIVGHCVNAIGKRSFRHQLLVLLFGSLIYLEFVAVPMKLDDRLVTMPSYYSEIGQASTAHSGGILDVPYDLFGARGPACDYMVYQTVHQRPIISGYISRTPQYAARMLDNYPFVRQLRARLYDDDEPLLFTNELITQGKHELYALNIEYIVLHKSQLSNDDSQVLENVITQVVSKPVYRDDRILVWRLP